jgi:hypothetical protein
MEASAGVSAGISDSQVGCWLESETYKTAHEQVSTSSCSRSNAVAGPSRFLMLLVLLSTKKLKDKVDRNYILIRAVYRLYFLCCRRIHVHLHCVGFTCTQTTHTPMLK